MHNPTFFSFYNKKVLVEKIERLTYEWFLVGRLWRKTWFPKYLIGTPLWKNQWMIRLTFWKRTFLTNSYKRQRFKNTIIDGYFWKRLHNYVMNKSCGWYECEMCSSNPDAFADPYEDYE